MTKAQRYKVGYYTDEWGMSSNTPCLIPDDSGYAVRLEDYCKLEAKNKRLERNLSTTEQTMREYQELAAKRLEEIAKYRDAPVVAWRYIVNDTWVNLVEQPPPEDAYDEDTLVQLIVKPGEKL